MSENLDLVRSIYARWQRGDYDSSAWAAPEIECVRADGPDPGIWRGTAALADAWRDFLSAWRDYQITVDEYRELDDERVLVFTTRLGRGQTSGLEASEIASSGATLWIVRGGKVIKQIAYWDRERALTDLGIAG